MYVGSMNVQDTFEESTVAGSLDHNIAYLHEQPAGFGATLVLLVFGDTFGREREGGDCG